MGQKRGKNKEKDDGFTHLTPIPGGRYDRFKKNFTGIKIPKSSDKFLFDLVETYGADKLVNMLDVDIGQYVYSKGLVHALNMNVGRNIPWIEDGLKSGERRALYIMWAMGLHRGKKEKVASIVGSMIKDVYPHGEQAPADIIFRLGRKRSTMIPYVLDGGDFGNMDEMRPASPRYASASLSPYAIDCFFSEIGARAPLYDTKDNYNFSGKEPVFLTSRYPNILMQWNQGIGKGASSWLGAFNSKDVFKTALKLLDNPNADVEIYPDLPIPAQIINKSKLKNCFDEREFKVQLRAPYELELDHRMEGGKVVDKHTIVFTALPITVIGKLIKMQITKIKKEDETRSNKRLPEVLNVEPVVDDDSPGGIRLIVEYEKGYDPHALAEKLYRATDLAKTVGVKYMLITDNRTVNYTPRQILNAWVTQRYDQKRRFYHQEAIQAAKERAKLDAICTVLHANNIDRAIKIIRSSNRDAESIAKLMKEFGFTEFQARMILGIPLGSLQKMDIEKTQKDRDNAIERYKHYRKLLTDELYIKEAIREELESGLKKYGRPRMAPLSNLDDTASDDNTTKKWVVYNKENYYCLSNPAELQTIANKLDKSYQIICIKNQDMVMLVDKKGAIKVLGGYAFSFTEQPISMSAFGLADIVRVLPTVPEHGYDQVALMTKLGSGKVMNYNECTKSIKGKLIMLGEGDELADIIPIQSRNAESDIIGVTQGDVMYYVKVSDFPVLKRSSTGNRVIKGVKSLELNRMFYFDMSKTDQILVYGESGYIKIIDVMYLAFSKRKANTITLNGKGIIGAVSLVGSKENKLTLYDNKGQLGIQIEIDKAVKFSTSTGESQKFKMSTSIGNPVKVFKKTKTDFYCLL